MRLKKLILHGFKSFADRTEFVFDSPITGIVGPNGCGKSNVVDGFKWVLGEQSAKSLRGEAMLDVIFNGSGGRKPAGVAEVTLVFDNPKRDDGSRVLHLDVDEVSVGRRLYRDGTSEYQLNNSSARLKDVRELFLDTGVGVDAYSVIEQGRVAALLEANPEERRLIFEEAAGISKFKQRKKEAQRKLEKVDQNLLRVNDIVEEVEKRLRSVKVQAGRARTYQEHSQRLAALRLTYALHDYHTQHTKLAELEGKGEDAQFRLDDAAADLASKQNELAEKREQSEGLSQAKQRIEYELVQAQAALQSARQKQQYAEQQLRQMAEQIEAFEADRADVEQRLAAVTESLGAETESLARLTAELEEQRRLIEERQAAFRDGQLKLNSLNQQIEQHKAAVLDLMRRLSSLNSRIGAIEIERKNIAAQQARLAERRRAVMSEVETLESQRAEAQSRLDAALAAIAEQQAQLDDTREQASQLGRQIALVGEQLGAAKEHRSGLLSRQKLLRDLEARREGVSEGVKSVLRKREAGQPFSFVRGLVADVLRVDVEHAHAIEAALDGRDQWLVAEDSSAVAAAREAFEDLEGRVNVLCTDVMEEPDRVTGASPVLPDSEAQPEHGRAARATDADYDWNQHPQRVRLAVDLVRFEPADAALAHHLLGRTVVVSNFDDAVELHNTGPEGWRYVTHGGEVLESDGTLRAGPLTAAMGLLSRRSELEALVQQIAEVDARIDQLTAQLSEGNTAARGLQDREASLRNDIYRSNTAKVELSSLIAQNQDKLGALRREQPVLDRELENLLEQVGRLKTEEDALAEQRSTVEAEQARQQYLADEAAAEQRRLSEELRHNGEQLTAARVQLGQVQEKQLAGQQQVQRLTSARRELGQQAERLARSAEAVEAKRGGVEDELEDARSTEAGLVEKQRVLAEQIQTVAADAKSAAEAVQEMGRAVETLRGRHGEVEQELHHVQLKLGEVKVRLETLVQRTMEELQLDLPAKYEAMQAEREGAAKGGAAADGDAVSEGAEESADPDAPSEFTSEGESLFQPEGTDWDAVAEEIKVLRDKIHRLGNVNLDAINEQDELEQRSTFMANQLNDLRDSKAQLEELIDTINTESSARFEQTFNAVREHFQGMFRKLFGGGKADVYLETELEEKRPAKAVKSQVADGDGQGPLALEGEVVKKKVDVLDAGIEIIARPPGKQPVSISQLSGGEKTMTCVALLMSIFKSKPSPFCILDEVDAALDEANNQRFNGIVQEFLEQSQFIVITHSKRTMQIADVLYGVTMQEQGVSKKVAVKFDQVDAEGRINEQAAA